MGVGLTKRKTLTINERTNLSRINPISFGKYEAEMALKDTSPGTYLMYKDYESNQIYLSVRTDSVLRHHMVTQSDGLFYLDKQPYPYLDSIVLYHKKHKLHGIKLTQQAPLSARIVKCFAARFAANNGNILPQKTEDKNKMLEETFDQRYDLDISSWSTS
eukprot:XP_014790290.1 PREDICTED: uncharacterized protein LOC106883693 [Octopus bimaculoides]